MKKLLFLSILSLFLFSSCQKENINIDKTQTKTFKSIEFLPSILPSTFDIIAGQNILVGDALFFETSNGLEVTYKLVDGWELNNIHFWIGTDPTSYPQTKNGSPIPGKLPYNYKDLGWVNTYTFTISDISDWCENTQYFILHCELRKDSGEVNDFDEIIYQTETGWSSGLELPGKNWAMQSYFSVSHYISTTDLSLDCDQVTPSINLNNAITSMSNLELSFWKRLVTDSYIYEPIDPIVNEPTVPGLQYIIRGTSPMGCEIESVVFINNTCGIYGGGGPDDPEIIWGNDNTGWAFGPKYNINVNGNWATYVEYNNEEISTSLKAGQYNIVGIVKFSPTIEGDVKITITMNSACRLKPEVDNYHIQGYDVAPTGNPAPGQFTYKGSTDNNPSEIIVPYSKYYGVHTVTQTIVQ